MTGSFGLLSEEDDLAHEGDDHRKERAEQVCVFCGCLGGHFTGCQVAPR